jgi:transposase-like protein
MAVARKQYTREFKHEAVRLVIEQGPSIAQAARDLGLHGNLFSRWKKEMAQTGEQTFPLLRSRRSWCIERSTTLENRPERACFTILRSSTAEDEGIQHGAISARTTTS